MKHISWKDLNKSYNKDTTELIVNKDSKLQSILLDYVGEKLKPETDDITVEMIIKVMADEFPDFLMAVAEKNWIRGYQQAMADMDKDE